MSSKRDSAKDDNPFLGPDPLSAQQPVFGRNEDIAALRSLILAERVVLMHGVSGAGKSSVLKGNGGICSSFRNERGFSVLGPIDLRVAITENVKDLYQRTLIEEIIRQNEIDSDQEINGDELRELFDLELLIMHFAREAGSSYQLLIIDQFEDIFTRLPYDEEGRKNFFEMLGGILERNEGLKVLLSMRDEYLGEIDRFRRFIPGRLRANFRLELLRKQQAFDAITLTVKSEPYNVRLCAEDVKAMVEDLSNLGDSDLGGEKQHTWESHFVEPLFLQLACRDAWPGILARYKQELYADDGEAPCVSLEGSASTEELDAVLSRFYENIVKTVKPNSANGDELKLRLFVQDGLITPNGVRNLIGEEEALLLWGLSGDAINTLVKAHLVRPQRRNRETFYELAHDRLLAPIKSNNEKRINTLPDWRKAARLWNRGGGSDRNLSIAQQFLARLTAKRAPDSLPPYEKRFIAEKAAKTRSFFVRALVFLSVWLIIGATTSYLANTKVRNIIDSQQLKLDAVLKDNEAVLKENKDKSEKLQNQKEALKFQQDYSKVQALMAGYAQRKWVDKNDEAAILQVREAYEEAGRRFGANNIPQSLTASFLAAFNNAMTPNERSPGFSHTFPVSLNQDKPVAIHPGKHPRIAFYDTKQECLAIRYLEDRSSQDNCVGQSTSQPESLSFDPLGRYLVAQYSNGLSIFDIARSEADGFVTPQIFEVDQPVDLFSISVDGKRIGYLSKGSVNVLCLDKAWSNCAKRAMPAGFSELTSMAISYALNGKRSLAVARKSGDVMLMSFADGLVDGYIASINKLTTIEEPGRLYRYFKDDRQVLNLGFMGTSHTLLVVHKDTQIFLMRINRSDNQLVKSVIVPKESRSKAQTNSEEGNKHFQTAVLSSDASLFTVLEDEITQWDLSDTQMDGFKGEEIGIPSVLWETGSRNLNALYVDKEWILGRGFFNLWLWERDRSQESKLITSKFPDASSTFEPDLLFYPQAISFEQDRKLIVGTTQHGLMRWSPSGSDEVWIKDDLVVCKGFKNIPVRSVALSSDRRMIAMAMGRNRLMVLPLSGTVEPMLCDKQVHQDGLWAVSFSHDGHWLVSGDYKGKAHLWKIGSEGLKYHAELQLENQNPIRSMAFHPKYNLLAIGKWQFTEEGDTGDVELLRFSDEGNLLESRILEFREGGIGSILDVGFSNDGKSLVAAGSSGPMQLWRINNNDPLTVETSRVLPGHAGGSRALAFNPKLDYLASGGADGLVRVWDLKDTNSVTVSANLKGIDADVLSLAWHKDGKQLAVSYKHSSAAAKEKSDKQTHGIVALWDWDLSRLSEIVCETAWRPLNAKEWTNWIEPLSKLPYQAACGGTPMYIGNNN
ncbi:MAG: hypothetical protein QNL05_00875 [Gammaproteobacteria bacterium]|nr:hypothetical protein [Gammaproteobacteria bacterium]